MCAYVLCMYTCVYVCVVCVVWVVCVCGVCMVWCVYVHACVHMCISVCALVHVCTCVCICMCALLEWTSGPSHMLSKCSSVESHPQPLPLSTGSSSPSPAAPQRPAVSIFCTLLSSECSPFSRWNMLCPLHLLEAELCMNSSPHFVDVETEAYLHSHVRP